MIKQKRRLHAVDVTNLDVIGRDIMGKQAQDVD